MQFEEIKKICASHANCAHFNNRRRRPELHHNNTFTDTQYDYTYKY